MSKNITTCSYHGRVWSLSFLTMAAAVGNEQINSLSVKELRELISGAGLSFSDCVEKSDLRARAVEALEIAKRNLASNIGTEATRSQILGGYECLVIASETKPDLVVCLLHGFGAQSSDFATMPSLTEKCASKRFGQA